ncbi:MAG: two-component system nitrogen regulation sensor histidine kinase NtrY [Flavobacteriales bacterium]
MKFRSLTLHARLLLVSISSLLAAITLIVAIYRFSDDFWLATIVGFTASLLITVVLIHYLTKTLYQRFDALRSGMFNLIDNDFSVSLSNRYDDELGELLELYNRVTEKMRDERQNLYQRELLLDTVIQNSSLYLILSNAAGRIIYSSHQARKLLNEGKPINGLQLHDILEDCPEGLKNALSRERDGLFTIGDAGDNESFHLSRGKFVLNTQVHQLILIKQLTRELNRQETQIWKKVIRIISHELNNSLAPISSMAHSGATMIEHNKLDKLPQVFDAISGRANHLKNFIEQYASMAKLPSPNRTWVSWRSFMQGIDIGYKYRLLESLPETEAYFDSSQMQQVLVNLLKNTNESGSSFDDITLCISTQSGAVRLILNDRGQGMSKRVMEQALLPFYTTKSSGSGIGLPLCRDIVEAHLGELSYNNRDAGGLSVVIQLPQPISPVK